MEYIDDDGGGDTGYRRSRSRSDRTGSRGGSDQHGEGRQHGGRRQRGEGARAEGGTEAQAKMLACAS